MFDRKILQEINHLKNQFRILTLIGPRQAGKTTLCKMAFPTYRYVSLEDPDQRAWATEDPRAFLAEYNQHIIFDEIQRVPSLLSYIQGIVDRDNIKAQFILTGSHQLELSQAVSQSLAGRTALLTLLPLSFEELRPESINPDLDLLNGFMPGKHKDQISNARFYRAYFQTYVERDVRALVNVKDFVKFENFVRLCAGRTGQLLNQASLATDAGVSTTTVNHWLSILESSFIIFRLQPYFENFGKRITKSSKLYFLDTGLAAWLLGIEQEHQMKRDPLRGSLFENMVVIDYLKSFHNRGEDPRLYFFRDSHGNEVDLLLQKGRFLEPIEIKASQTWQNSFLKGIRFVENLLQDRAQNSTVVYAGEQTRNNESYRLLPYQQAACIQNDRPNEA